MMPTRSFLCPGFAALLLSGCVEAPPAPLGMTLADDGVTYAGTGLVDITPEIIETFSDLDGSNEFEGCLDDPGALRAECDEPFDDVNGNGWFDAVFIGGFGPMRPALGVHDPIWARATVLSHDEQYIAFVSLDVVGLGSPNIHAARDRLVADGYDIDRLIVASSHNHQGPDTMGLWGDPTDFDDPVTGRNPAYQERVQRAIEEAVRAAAGSMEPVELRVGRTLMRDRGVWFNGARFGGKNPTDRMHGMINDGRDPVVVSDQLLVVQGVRPGTVDDAVFTLTNWSGHPEVRGSSNNLISSDWIGVERVVLEDRFGGMAMHLPESLGGMQSALGGDLPLVTDLGEHVFAACGDEEVADVDDVDCFGRSVGETRVDGDGDAVPVWAPKSSWEFVTSHGHHIAEAAIDALAAGEGFVPSPLHVDVETFYVPVDNVAYQLLGPRDLFDLGLEDAITDTSICPRAAESGLGCLENRTFRLRMGPIGFVTVPGELLPELAWGVPDHPDWAAEALDPTQRGPGSTFFEQHDHACDAYTYNDCQGREAFRDCDCLAVHAWPYRLSDALSDTTLLEPLDTEYRAILGMADNYLSYIIPAPDFNHRVTLLSDEDGDHYEDTVSPSWDFAPELLAAQGRIASRWAP